MIKILRLPLNLIYIRYGNIIKKIKIECINSKKLLKEKKQNKAPYTALIYIQLLFVIIKEFFIEIIILLIIAPSVLYLIVTIYSSSYIYDSIELIPEKEVALVLGTSKYMSDGRINMYFTFRMKAAHKLYKNKKIKYILVSGDNRHSSYNEPRQMRADLIRLGIPKENIFLDFAGFRTRDSIIRANKVFGLTSFTIVSQSFHNERAVFIARQKGIDAIGYNAENVRILHRIKQAPREIASRIIMALDIIIDKPPYFYGDPIKIEEKIDYKSNHIYKNITEN